MTTLEAIKKKVKQANLSGSKCKPRPIGCPMQKNHGGKRPNAGRKPSPYKTTTVSVRVRVEWVESIKKTIKDKVDELKNNVKI